MKSITEIDKTPMRIEYLDQDGNVVVEEKNFDSLSYEEKSSWYSTICSAEEVDRIINMRTGKDYILRLRADAIIANKILLSTNLYFLLVNKNQSHILL